MRLGILAGAAAENAEEAAIVTLCVDGEGDRILMCVETAAPPRVGEGVEIIAYSGDAEGDAQRVRAALSALRDRPRKGKKKKDTRGAQGGLAITPAGASRVAPAARPAHARLNDEEVLVAPKAPVAPKPAKPKRTAPSPSARQVAAPPPPVEIDDITPATHIHQAVQPAAVAQVSELGIHDPERAQRVRKVGFFLGIGLGMVVMSVVVGLYLRSHAIRPSTADVAPAPAVHEVRPSTADVAPAAAVHDVRPRVAEVAPAHAPAASIVVPEMPPQAVREPEPAPELRGTLDPPHVEN
jgi:hypothetical protein